VNTSGIIDRFYTAFQSKDRDALLNSFSSDAMYDDPDLKRAGLVVRTSSAIARMLFGRVSTLTSFQLHHKKISVTQSNSVVNWTITFIEENETKEKVLSGTDTFSFDRNGKIIYLSSFWSPSEVSFGKIEPVYSGDTTK
jgi:hypothetical protein